jgi:hypothetical protein
VFLSMERSKLIFLALSLFMGAYTLYILIPISTAYKPPAYCEGTVSDLKDSPFVSFGIPVFDHINCFFTAFFADFSKQRDKVVHEFAGIPGIFFYSPFSCPSFSTLTLCSLSLKFERTHTNFSPKSTFSSYCIT